MFRIATALVVAAGLALGSPVRAGEYNKKISVGDAAPTWTGLEGVDGKKHALADLKEKDVVVVFFTCNHCPVAEGYEDRMIEFTKKYAGADAKVAIVAISIEAKLEEDRLPAMKERAKAKGFKFAYLSDPSQKIGREFGAVVTPQFFLLNKERKIAYMGAMDDNYEEEKVTKHYLEDAVKAVLGGKAPTLKETRPRGCGIEYESK